MSSDSPPAPTDAAAARQGRWIRAALVILPAGTIILGIGSFGIWWQKEKQQAERTYKFATALRRDMTAAAVDRYAGILREVIGQGQNQGLPAVAAFLESSMSPENMGYEVRRVNFNTGPLEVANVDVELTGTRRSREVTLVLVPYSGEGVGDSGTGGGGSRLTADCQALAGMMALAQSLTGEVREATVRFAAIPLGVKDPGGRSAIERMVAASRERQERLMRVYVLGGPDEALLGPVRQAIQPEVRGTVIQALPATLTAAETVAAMAALRTQL